MDTVYLWNKKIWFQVEGCSGNLVLISPQSKGRVSKLCYPAVSLMAAVGIDCSAGEMVFKTLVYVYYQRM